MAIFRSNEGISSLFRLVLGLGLVVGFFLFIDFVRVNGKRRR